MDDKRRAKRLPGGGTAREGADMLGEVGCLLMLVMETGIRGKGSSLGIAVR
jgi:hypothetical protein